MNAEEELFLKEWEAKRRTWKWGRALKNGILYFAIPIVLIIDFVNFFIISDVSFGFFSFSHLWELVQTLIIFSLIIGCSYGAFSWYSNELRFQKLRKKELIEKKKALKSEQ